VPSIRTGDAQPEYKQEDCQSVANPITGVSTQPEHHADDITAIRYEPFGVSTAVAGPPVIPGGIGNMSSMFTIAVSCFYHVNQGSLSLSKGSEL
jgi:hypothetical protein